MMAELCRSRQGDFVLGGANCLEYSDLIKGEELWAPKVQSMLAHWNDGTRSVPTAAPVRAKHVRPSDRAQTSVEGPPAKKFKASEEKDTREKSPKVHSRPPSRDVKMTSPKIDSPTKAESSATAEPTSSLLPTVAAAAETVNGTLDESKPEKLAAEATSAV